MYFEITVVVDASSLKKESLQKSYEFSLGYLARDNVEQTRIKVITGAVEDIIFLMERLFYNETVEEAKKVLRKELLSWILEELFWDNGENP